LTWIFSFDLGNFSWQDVYDALQEAPAFEGYPIGGNPGATLGKKWDNAASRVKIQRVFGKDETELFRPFSVTIRDTVSDIKARGW
jgi:hypothetical protein